jgi:hypothetical protein
MKILSWMMCGLFSLVVLVPVGAHARECQNAVECVADLALHQLDSRMSTVSGVAAAAVIAAGAVVTAARPGEKPAPEGVVRDTDPNGKPKVSLELLPSRVQEPVADPVPSTPAERKRSANALRVNEAITNVGLVVTGAAVLGAMVGSLAANAKKH